MQNYHEIAIRNYQSCELEEPMAKRFSAYCKDMHIKYETSAAGYGLTHFECFVSDAESKSANEFISRMEVES